jgi:hypothetical protein
VDQPTPTDALARRSHADLDTRARSLASFDLLRAKPVGLSIPGRTAVPLKPEIVSTLADPSINRLRLARLVNV